jgi:hypothetical protein
MDNIKKSSFSEEVLSCINGGLSNFGDNGGQVILHHVFKMTKLTGQEIVRRPHVFDEALAEMFGEGAKAVKCCVIEAISNSFGFSPDSVGSIAEAVWEAKVRHLQKEIHAGSGGDGMKS